jgi:hypothetical protein
MPALTSAPQPDRPARQAWRLARATISSRSAGVARRGNATSVVQGVTAKRGGLVDSPDRLPVMDVAGHDLRRAAVDGSSLGLVPRWTVSEARDRNVVCWMDAFRRSQSLDTAHVRMRPFAGCARSENIDAKSFTVNPSSASCRSEAIPSKAWLGEAGVLKWRTTDARNGVVGKVARGGPRPSQFSAHLGVSISCLRHPRLGNFHRVPALSVPLSLARRHCSDSEK